MQDIIYSVQGSEEVYGRKFVLIFDGYTRDMQLGVDDCESLEIVGDNLQPVSHCFLVCFRCNVTSYMSALAYTCHVDILFELFSLCSRCALVQLHGEIHDNSTAFLLHGDGILTRKSQSNLILA